MARLELALVLSGALAAGAGPSVAGALQEPLAFVAEAFAGTPPPPGTLWLTGARRSAVAAILGHDPAVARLRYWRADRRCALVLDEVAHSQPITAGFIVDGARIERARVLVYREARGWEVQRAPFLAQLEGRALGGDGSLDRAVDGITGASQSVAAMTRMARLALFLAHEAELADGR